MKKQIFRISKNDEIKARALSENNNLLALVYDSGFTTINEVVSVLMNKIPYTSGKKITIVITNVTKETVKYIDKNINF